MYITNTTNEFTMGSSHVVFLNIFFYGDVTQKRHWQKNLPVGFNGLMQSWNFPYMYVYNIPTYFADIDGISHSFYTHKLHNKQGVKVI